MPILIKCFVHFIYLFFFFSIILYFDPSKFLLIQIPRYIYVGLRFNDVLNNINNNKNDGDGDNDEIESKRLIKLVRVFFKKKKKMVIGRDH